MVAQAERGMTAALDQTQEAVAFDELDLAQLDRGDGNQRRPAGNYCTQSQYLMVASNFKMIVLPSRARIESLARPPQAI